MSISYAGNCGLAGVMLEQWNSNGVLPISHKVSQMSMRTTILMDTVPKFHVKKRTLLKFHSKTIGYAEGVYK